MDREGLAGRNDVLPCCPDSAGRQQKVVQAIADGLKRGVAAVGRPGRTQASDDVVLRQRVGGGYGPRSGSERAAAGRRSSAFEVPSSRISHGYPLRWPSNSWILNVTAGIKEVRWSPYSNTSRNSRRGGKRQRVFSRVFFASFSGKESYIIARRHRKEGHYAGISTARGKSPGSR